MLNNLETPKAKLLQIVLVGRPELQDKLHVHLRQRLGSTSKTHPLSDAETKAYIQHRVTVAGGDAQALFTPRALKAICAYAGGVPQRINTLCDKALLTAYAAGQPRISAHLVRQGIRDLEPRPRHSEWAMRLQKTAAVLAVLLTLSTVSATYPPVQTSLQQAYEFVKLQIENSIFHMFEPSSTLADGPNRSKS
jgi:general secretion pathway protein A